MIARLFALTGLALSLCCLSTSVSAIENGQELPHFSMTTYDGRSLDSTSLRGRPVVFEWFNPQCPFVRKHYRNSDMAKLQGEYTGKGVTWVMVNSTAQSHRDYFDSTAMQEWLTEKGVGPQVTVVNDANGSIGRAFGARTTPHMFVFDSAGKLRYQGAIDDDDSASGDPKAARNFVREALDALGSSSSIGVASTDSYGCSVKYAS